MNKSNIIDGRLLLSLYDYSKTDGDVIGFIVEKYKIENYQKLDYGSVFLNLSNPHERGSIQLCADLVSSCLRLIRTDCYSFLVKDQESSQALEDIITENTWDIKNLGVSPVFWDIRYLSKSQNESYNLEFLIKYHKYLGDERQQILNQNFIGYFPNDRVL